MKPGDKVQKNKKTWVIGPADKYGAGKGIGTIVCLHEDKQALVKWSNTLHCYKNLDQLEKIESQS